MSVTPDTLIYAAVSGCRPGSAADDNETGLGGGPETAARFGLLGAADEPVHWPLPADCGHSERRLQEALHPHSYPGMLASILVSLPIKCTYLVIGQPTSICS